jgi:hypothetical protein
MAGGQPIVRYGGDVDSNYIQGLCAAYEARAGLHGTSDAELAQVEEALGVVLPSDVRAVARVYRGGDFLACIEQLEFGGSGPGTITHETLQLRAAGLPLGCLVLAQGAESYVLLECQAASDTQARVVWADVAEAELLSTQASDQDFYRVFRCFADYFAWLLRKEWGVEVEHAV